MVVIGGYQRESTNTISAMTLEEYHGLMHVAVHCLDVPTDGSTKVSLTCELRRLVVVLHFLPGSIRVGQDISNLQRLFVVPYFMPGSIRIGLLISERSPEVGCCFVFRIRLYPCWAAYQRSRLFVVSYFMPGSIRIGLLISERSLEVDCCFVFHARLDPSWAAAQTKTDTVWAKSSLEYCNAKKSYERSHPLTPYPPLA